MNITLEHLELAALAAGLKHVNYDGLGYDGRGGLVLVDGIGRHLEYWRPHTDIADAARLAVHIGARVDAQDRQVRASAIRGNLVAVVRHRVDGTRPGRERAYCEAITLCAAEIGRRMQEGGR